MAALFLKNIILIHFNNFKDLCYLTNPAPSFLQHTQTSSVVRWYCLDKKQSHVGQLGRHVKALKGPVTANNFRGLRLAITGQTFTFAMPMENQVEIKRVKQIVSATRSKIGWTKKNLWPGTLKYHAGLFLYYYKAAESSSFTNTWRSVLPCTLQSPGRLILLKTVESWGPCSCLSADSRS